jgi:NAD(P)H-dependent FMN reductase
MPLNLLVFLGSARASSPPQPVRLGLRVARACVAQLQDAGHTVTLIDPLDVPLDPVFTPHFAFAAGKAPAALQALAEQIAAADGYVMVSPEYNHSMSPALANLLNHFASSLFAFKPSAIVTYSAGQWGGARAAMGMRAYLGELGLSARLRHGASGQGPRGVHGRGRLCRGRGCSGVAGLSRALLQSAGLVGSGGPSAARAGPVPHAGIPAHTGAAQCALNLDARDGRRFRF